MTSPRILVLSHNPEVGLGYTETILRDGGCLIHTASFPLSVEPPSAGDVDGVVCLGGTYGVADPGAAWIVREIEFVRTSVKRGVPFLGICFGAQILAAAFGGAVFKAARPELGLISVVRTPQSDADPLFGALAWAFQAPSWHGDTFDLPPGATLLATSADCLQAFRVDDSAYGIQFHPEASGAVFREWLRCRELKSYAEFTLGEQGVIEVLTAFDRHPGASVLRQLVGAWMRLCEGRSTTPVPAPTIRTESSPHGDVAHRV